MFQIALIALFLFLTACDPTARSARVRPDKTSEIQLRGSGRRVPVDIYLSKDQKVELQVFASGPTVGVSAPSIEAVIVNKREEPIQVDLNLATYQPTWSAQPIAIQQSFYDGCEFVDLQKTECRVKSFELLPGEAKQVMWKTGAEGDFRLPILSKHHSSDAIVVKFRRCSPLWRRCETEK